MKTIDTISSNPLMLEQLSSILPQVKDKQSFIKLATDKNIGPVHNFIKQIQSTTTSLPKDLVKYPSIGLGTQVMPAKQFVDIHKSQFDEQLTKYNNDSTKAFNELVTNLKTPYKTGVYSDFNKVKNPIVSPSRYASLTAKMQKGGSSSEFIFNPKTMKSTPNPNAKMGLESVSPEFMIMTGGVGALGTKALTTAGKIGQTMLHGAGQGAIANMSNLSGSEQNVQGLATDILGGAVIGGLLKGSGLIAKNSKEFILNKLYPYLNGNKSIPMSGYKPKMNIIDHDMEIPPMLGESIPIVQKQKEL